MRIVNAQVAPLYEQAKLNTRLFLNALAGSDDMAQVRPGDGTNNLAFIALHLLDARAFLARLLGAECRHAFQAQLDQVNTIEQMVEYPPLEAVRTSWHEVSSVLVDALSGLSAGELGRKASQEFPVNDETVLGGLAFLLQHEAYHIGQLALLRRLLGLSPMSYT